MSIKLCKQLESIDEKLQFEVDYLIKALKSNLAISFVRSSGVSAGNKFKKSVKFRDQKSKLANAYGDENDSENEEMRDESLELETEGTAKRPINYEIEKNRGLTPNRPKMYRNPRVRNRFKARKANIKHKSIVPKVRSQEKRYTGEATGIRLGVVRAHKIK